MDSFLLISNNIWFFLIFTFGILHGANDLLFNYIIQNNQIHGLKFRLLCLSGSLTGILLFYTIPQVALFISQVPIILENSNGKIFSMTFKMALSIITVFLWFVIYCCFFNFSLR
jgi:hypothetical protein